MSESGFEFIEIKDTCYMTLEDRVRDKLKAGWELWGTRIISRDGVFSQAMVKYEC